VSLLDGITFGSENCLESIDWQIVPVCLKKKTTGEIIYKCSVVAPSFWSQQSVEVTSSKYFYGGKDEAVREKSIQQLIHRVASQVAAWGRDLGYFDTEESNRFYNALCHLFVNQCAAPNSPVFFNCGLSKEYGLSDPHDNKAFWSKDIESGSIVPSTDLMVRPQMSACFVVAVDDNMWSIANMWVQEAMIFKYGSGVGVNRSTLRSAREKLSGGGMPSGPLTFMQVGDRIAQTVKSGGKFRRAAKMEILNADHPDIMEFIAAKSEEEKKALALIREGYSTGLDGDAYSSVFFQNSNFSVRLTDQFMQAYVEGADWETKAVTTGKVVEVLKARDVMSAIASAAWTTGCPGVQFHDTYNRWNTCPASGIIWATNPCAEFVPVGKEGACNLASINVVKFIMEDGSFDYEGFCSAVRLLVIMMDIIVTMASYPSKAIATAANRYRSVGLGYTNLGSALMRLGLPYDSAEGRLYAAALTSCMTASAYQTSQLLAEKLGAFDGYEENAGAMAEVMHMHLNKHEEIVENGVESLGLTCASWLPNPRKTSEVWRSLWRAKRAFRNSAVSCQAPTGTISFYMGADTTGIEPLYAIVTEKALVGGQSMTMVSDSVRPALVRLGYTDEKVEKIMGYVSEHDSLHNCPFLKDKDRPVFACAAGEGTIHYMGHVKMLEAVQPFLSMGISKTVNLPQNTTAKEIEELYVRSWKMGLKSISVFRAGCRQSPLTAGKEKKVESVVRHPTPTQSRPIPERYELPETCRTVRHKFQIGPHKGYLHVGLYDDGSPGELFVTMAKQGSTIRGLLDAFSIAVSNCLQHGVPVNRLVEKFRYMDFEPRGWTPNERIGQARSVVDYIFRWIGIRFLDTKGADVDQSPKGKIVDLSNATPDGGVCAQCGHYPMMRSGTCSVCPRCGTTTGCS